MKERRDKRRRSILAMLRQSAASYILYIFTNACANGDFGAVPPEDNTEDGSEGIGGGCRQLFYYPIPENLFICGSYESRGFLNPGNHLGCDIALPEGFPIQAPAYGPIVYAGAARGYGRWIVVTEVTLPGPIAYRDSSYNTHYTDKMLIAFGHLRNFEANGSEPLRWRIGDYVSPGDVIGYIDADATNGDGGLHVHVLTRMMGVDEARERDSSAWFRGYDTASRTHRDDFINPVQFIRERISNLKGCGKDELAENDNELHLVWQTPLGARYSEVSGRVWNEREEEIVPWHTMYYNTRDDELFVNLPLAQNHAFEFSIEYRHEQNSPADEHRWSCEGAGTVNGEFSAEWNGLELPVLPTPNGVGGCNLIVRADPVAGEPPHTEDGFPADSGDDSSAPRDSEEASADNEESESEEDREEEDRESEPADDEESEPADDEESEPRPRAENTIFCERRDGRFLVHITGRVSETLIDEPITDIRFLSAGSDVTGWRTQTDLPAYYAIYNGDGIPHILVLPNAVTRFNIWAAGPEGTGWFMLWEWTAGGVCRIAAEDGGYIIYHD